MISGYIQRLWKPSEGNELNRGKQRLDLLWQEKVFPPEEERPIFNLLFHKSRVEALEAKAFRATFNSNNGLRVAVFARTKPAIEHGEVVPPRSPVIAFRIDYARATEVLENGKLLSRVPPGKTKPWACAMRRITRSLCFSRTMTIAKTVPAIRAKQIH